MKDISEYFGSEWSHSSFKIMKGICCFSDNNEIICVCDDGTYLSYYNTRKNDEYKQNERFEFLKKK